MPRLCELYPGICLTTKEKARKNLSQGSRRVPVINCQKFIKISDCRDRINEVCSGGGRGGGRRNAAAICAYILITSCGKDVEGDLIRQTQQ